MSLAMDIPQIAITPEHEDDDREYFDLAEALTDIEDLDDEPTEKRNVPKFKSKLKIKLVEDDFATDYEDVEGSDKEDDDEKIIQHENPISLEDVYLENGVYEELFKAHSPNQLKGGKKLKTQRSVTQYIDHKDADFRVVENHTDEEEFNTDNEISANESGNENTDAYEMEESEVLDNIISKNLSTSMSNLTLNENQSGFLTSPSISPYLSELTDIDVIDSDSNENDSQKKKVKRKRHSSRRVQILTDVEDVEFSETELKQAPYLRKNVRRNKHSSNVKKSQSLFFDSDNEDDDKLPFPVCKRIAGKRLSNALSVPELNSKADTDVEEFENTAEDISLQENLPNSEPESDETLDGIISGCGEINESHSVKNKEELNDNDETDKPKDIPKLVKEAKKRKKAVDKPAQSAFLNVEVDEAGLTDCENLDSESDDDSIARTPPTRYDSLTKLTDEEEFENDSDNNDKFPDIELPKPVRNLVILKDTGTLPTVQILPLPDDLEAGEKPIGPPTDEESVSDAEDAYECLVGEKDDEDIPVYDWGSVDISEQSQNKTARRSENIRGDLTDTEEIFLDNPQKKRKPPKFKYMHDKFAKEKDKLKVKNDENLRNLTDTEDLNMSDENTQTQQQLAAPADDLDSGTDVEMFYDTEDIMSIKIRPISCTPQYLRELEGDLVSSKEGLGPFSQNDRLNTLKPIKRQIDYAVTPTHSDSEELVASADEDFTAYSRAETVTPNQLQEEIDTCVSSEIRVEAKKKLSPEGVMYLKGGGYVCHATDVEELSEEDMNMEGDVVYGFIRGHFELGFPQRKEWEAPKQPLELEFQSRAPKLEQDASQEDTHEAGKEGEQPSTSIVRAEEGAAEGEEPSSDRQFTDQHQLSEEMKELLRELEKESKQ